MENIVRLICELKEYYYIRENIENHKTPVEITGLSPINKANITAALAEDMHRQPVVICADDSACTRFARELEQFLDREVCILPYRDMVFYDVESSSREYEHKRISVLSQLKEGKKPVVMSVAALLESCIPPEIMKKACITIDFSQQYNIEELAYSLTCAGYQRCAQVEGAGQFSIRGGILDIFAAGMTEPVRIEFFGDDIDTMSFFDINSQRRGRSLQKLVCLPNREILPDMAEGGRDAVIAQLEKLLSSRLKKHKNLDSVLRKDIERVQNGGNFASIDKYISIIYPQKNTAADYIPSGALVFFDDFRAIREAARVHGVMLREDITTLVERGEIYGKYAEYGLDLNKTLEILNKNSIVYLESFLTSVNENPPKALAEIPAKQLSAYGGNMEAVLSDIKAYKDMGYRIIVLCGSQMRCRTVYDMLESENIRSSVTQNVPSGGNISISEGSLSTGFEFPSLKLAVLTEGQMFSSVRKKNKRRKSSREHVKSYTDLTPGDIVVHENHGIGRFIGMERVKIEGNYVDYIKIAFAGSDYIYVPATNMDMISKYIGNGGEDSHVKLSSLNGTEWRKTRTKAKAAAKEMAGKLVKLYAEREKEKGFAFAPDDEFQREFEASFEYEETEDQLRCADEIKNDMMSQRPMDRLLCGDVGFGKTEVALRAAMKCSLSGKQTAILVPTTVLARQHYLTCRQRFSAWPVKIEMLSRFQSEKEQKSIRERLLRGDIDILVGTHKLFNKSLKFKDLGLLIVDEEQRFGVSHKEKLKEMTKQVDVLTLSATPIPRTLNMALSGIRDMSVLEEPPSDRHPVQTYVMEYDDGVIKDAISREMHRGGQVYYLHNRVETIDSVAQKIQRYVPDSEIAIIHGQMSQRDINKIMTRMSSGEIDILVCTTIIETGIDIPNVNTLIIEDAERMGLSQLHQLRGRVGRSARHAFAYFTFQRGKNLSEASQKRLSAVREFAEFGSGFKIAMRDLEIRGAGNVLGAEQSGHMMNVGYDLYLKLLEEAVTEEKGEQTEQAAECQIKLRISANIPQQYISDDGQRVDIYRRISLIRTDEDKSDIIDELIDRWGEPPQETAAVCDIALLRAKASRQGINEIQQTDTHLNIFWQKADIRRLALLCTQEQMKGRLMLNAGNNPYVSIRLKNSEKAISMANDIVRYYADIVKNTAQEKA